MIKKFLVAVDGSDHGWKALDMAASLAKLSDAEPDHNACGSI
jgi:nucleotide-binding universal stress UspA family protein